MAVARVGLLAFVAGVGAVHLAAAPPGPWAPALLLVCALLFLIFLRRSSGWFTGSGIGHTNPTPSRSAIAAKPILCWVSAFAVGVLYGSFRAELRLADVLDPSNEDKVTRVVLRVAELPRIEPESRLFIGEVLSSTPQGVPTRILVRWSAPGYNGPFGTGRPASASSASAASSVSSPSALSPASAALPELIPGQVWRMALILRSPHGTRNPGGFDYEGHLFAQGVRAVGTVRGKPVLLDDTPWAGLSIMAQRARHHVREAMQPFIGDQRWGGVLLALAIGDQASVAASDWQTFNRSGLTHLVSISGSHVTMIAVMAGVVVNAGWRRTRWRGRSLSERFPAQLASAWVALVVSWLYCLLAGWGVPARRTFVMLAVVAVSLGWRLPMGATHVLAVAAFAVVAMDPWSLLSAGFWLSFLAVYVLMMSTGWWGQAVTDRSRGVWLRFRKTLATAASLQALITLALMPVLGLLFNEVSLVSPLANAYAIPLIGMLITPLSLLLAGLALISGWGTAAALVAESAHWLMEMCMWPTTWLASLRGASIVVATPPWGLTLFAMLGVGLALLPRGIPFRGLGWTFMLPALFWVPARPAPGDWELYALDVGQGSALVLRTAHRVLLYDTGDRYSPEADAAQRVLLPFLRTRGIRGIDVLVISHSDLDHVGGMSSVLDAMPVDESYAPFELSSWLAYESRLLKRQEAPAPPRARAQCAYGAGWRMDKVDFAFLWPLSEGSIDIHAGTRERNRNSCVLHIQGAHHAILLPGDITADEERTLVSRGLPPADVVLAAHHGSRYSSAASFVRTLGASHAIAQAGRWNRYGHPSELIRQRWQAQGATFWDTGRHGAMVVRSHRGRLTVQAERLHNSRYWAATSP